ncbi:MAG: DUF2927 domain-containing protein [Calditrichaeota bacterium]|nr:DUF2927 domain-containing protein [Calditrichota bacterium]
MTNKWWFKYLLLLRLTAFVSIAGLLACAGNSPNTLLSQPKIDKAVGNTVKSSDYNILQYDDLDYFSEIAFGSEYGFSNYEIKKWENDVELQVMGHPTQQDIAALAAVIADLNQLISPNLHITLVENGGNAEIHFIPHSEFYQFELPGLLFYGGFFRNWWQANGEIYRGLVVIGTDKTDQELRTHLIREELTQMLGLMNDSVKYPDSIFFQANSLTDKFSALDMRLIRYLYSNAIQPGMNMNEVRNRLKNDLAKTN